MKVAFVASDETIRLITANGFRALSQTGTAGPRVVLTEVDPRDPAALGGSAAVLLDIPDDQLSPFRSTETRDRDTRTFEVPVSFAERFPIIASRGALPGAQAADTASPAVREVDTAPPAVPLPDAAPPAGRLPRTKAPGLRHHRGGNVKLIASVAAAGVVTAGMVVVDLVTRDSMPVPPPTERVEIDIRSAVLLLPRTPAEPRRRSGRLTVQLRVTNISDRRLSLREPVLRVGRTTIRPESKVRRSAGAIVSPLQRGALTERVVRFNTTGGVTRRLIAGRRVAILIGGRTAPVTRESVDLVRF